MKYFFIDTEIGKELLNKFFKFANENQDEDWTITIYSIGGSTVFVKAISYILNLRKEKVTLIFAEGYSGAFELFYKAKCKKIITVECKGMIHLSHCDINVNRMGKVSDKESECIIQNWKENNSYLGWIKKILTPTEFKKYKNHEQVYLTTKRMKEIFPEAEII